MAQQKLTDEQRMSDEHMAVAMYSERVQADARRGEADIYARNPEARQMYFKGVFDALTVMDTWAEAGLTAEQLTEWMGLLQDQSREHAEAPTN